MPFICKTFIRAIAKLGALVAVFSCAALLAQTQSQSTVPHPPDNLRPQPSSTVPHPPDRPKQTTQAGADEQPDTTIKVNVKLVNVFTTVTDSAGSPVSI